METEFILYVADQKRSKEFYEQVLEISPSLHVPGMTEFNLSNSVKLGLMPEKGIEKILSNKVPNPSSGSGIPRCELYLKVQSAEAYLQRAVSLGGKQISAMENRDWGDRVGYASDLDGHILAFAEQL